MDWETRMSSPSAISWKLIKSAWWRSGLLERRLIVCGDHAERARNQKCKTPRNKVSNLLASSGLGKDDHLVRWSCKQFGDHSAFGYWLSELRWVGRTAWWRLSGEVHPDEYLCGWVWLRTSIAEGWVSLRDEYPWGRASLKTSIVADGNHWGRSWSAE